MGNNIKILSTAQLPATLLDTASTQGVVVDVLPFIQVVDITDHPAVQQELDKLYLQTATVVFTSANAVYAVCETPFFVRPNWNIFCTGHATKKAILEYFKLSSIYGTANDAIGLAHKIMVFKEINEVVFFCGDKRMDTLPDILREAGIQVNEVIVYETTETPKFVENEYSGVLFFSPSGVSSYFNLNIPDPDTMLFAIGETTAAAIRENTNNKIVVSSLPSKEVILKEAIAYLAISSNDN